MTVNIKVIILLIDKSMLLTFPVLLLVATFILLFVDSFC